MSTPAPRTLADQLRSWPPERVAALLDARPDLASPAPHDSAQLAARAVVRASVLRALDGLDALHLGVLDALVNGHLDAVHAEPEAVARALTRLADLALVWGEPPRPVTIVNELMLLPAGASVPPLDDLSPAARAVLDHLEETQADGRTTGPHPPTDELLDKGLLVRRDERHVSLPWSVRTALRGGRATRDRIDEPPALATSAREQAMIDRAAAGAAFELVRRTELLLDRWGTHPPGALKGGGLGIRDLRATATLLHVEQDVAALLIETAGAAGLLAQGMTDDHDAAWLPTDTFDSWQSRSVAERWTYLATAWLQNPRQVGLVGGRIGDKPVNALAPDLERSWMVDLRAAVLSELPGNGSTLAPGTGLSSLLGRLRWRRPRRPESRMKLVEGLLAEAAVVGVTGLDGLSTFGAALLEDRDPRELLSQHLPTPVDHILVQADLTAIAPGPLESDLARELALLADVESRGGATVYRFTAPSIRRAFDSGWSAVEVHDFVSATSRTPVPQALDYLIDDVSRRFGTLRIGRAETFLRSDDETALTELMHNPDAAAMRLRRIAPTVVVSDVPLGTLLPKLRDAGLAPAVEAADGTVRVARPDVFRSRPPRRRTTAQVGARATARSAAVVSAIRAGDRAAASRPSRPRAAVHPGEMIAMLRMAGEAGESITIGYVGNDGTIGERLIVPQRVEGGQVTAYDERSDSVRTFALHRITAATA